MLAELHLVLRSSYHHSASRPLTGVRPGILPDMRTLLLRKRLPIAWVQIGVLLAGLISYPFTKGVDPDFWWHLRTGDLIFHSGVPRHDPFSWTAAGHAWVAHEWLSEVLLYCVESAFGYWANVLLFGAIVAAALLLMYRLGRSSGAGTRPLVLLMYLSVATLGLYVTVRPQEFTWLGFTVFIYVLQRYYSGARAPVWALPPLMALWANLHLGFVYGLLLVGVWFGALAWERVRGRKVDLQQPAVIAAACVLASLLNPDGPALLWYPTRYVFDHRVTAYIGEWQRPTPLYPLYWPTFLTDILLALALVSRTRPKPFLWIVTAAMIALSLQAGRNAPFAALLLVPVAGGAMSGRWQAATSRSDSLRRAPLVPAVLLLAAVCAAAVQLGSRRSGATSFARPSESGYPSAAAAYVKTYFAGRRLFNAYGDGGYLIYTLYPTLKVGIDGRSDFYGGQMMSDYTTIYRIRPGWEELLTKYDPEIVLIPKQAPLAEKLRTAPTWRLAFSDDHDLVFTRS